MIVIGWYSWKKAVRGYVDETVTKTPRQHLWCQPREVWWMWGQERLRVLWAQYLVWHTIILWSDLRLIFRQGILWTQSKFACKHRATIRALWIVLYSFSEKKGYHFALDNKTMPIIFFEALEKIVNILDVYFVFLDIFFALFPNMPIHPCFLSFSVFIEALDLLLWV